MEKANFHLLYLCFCTTAISFFINRSSQGDGHVSSKFELFDNNEDDGQATASEELSDEVMMLKKFSIKYTIVEVV